MAKAVEGQKKQNHNDLVSSKVIYPNKSRMEKPEEKMWNFEQVSMDHPHLWVNCAQSWAWFFGEAILPDYEGDR